MKTTTVNKLLMTVTIVMAGTFLMAQNSGISKNDGNDIKIMAIIPTQADGLTMGSESALRNKMNQITTVNGLGSMSDYAQFCMFVSINLDNKEILGTSPTKIAQTVNFSFYIADQMNETLFSSTTVSTKGVGDNETKAYIQSINQLNANSPMIKNFIAEGKRKIIDYYIRNCDKIIAKANSLASMKQFGEALFLLMQVPDSCTECYYKSLTASKAIYKLYIDDLCERNLARAKSAWVAKQNSEGAQEAGEYLQFIYPEAACYKDAEKLHAEIKSKVKEDWYFVMKVYQDGVDLESQRINAMREVGVAWGKNQQPITYSPAFIVR